jgi:thiol-disulfide isomerase/thioredoxin
MRVILLWSILSILLAVATLLTFPTISHQLSFSIPFILSVAAGYFYRSKNYTGYTPFLCFVIPLIGFILLIVALNPLLIGLLIPEITIAWISGFAAGYMLRKVKRVSAKAAVLAISTGLLLLTTLRFIPLMMIQLHSSTVFEKINLPAEFSLGEKGKSISTKGKVVVLDFWNTGCGPCFKQQPIIKAIHENFAGRNDVIILAVNVDKDSLRATPKQQKLMASPIWHDHSGNLAKEFRITDVPVIAVIDREGAVRWVIKGFNKDIGAALEDVLSAKIEECLK